MSSQDTPKTLLMKVCTFLLERVKLHNISVPTLEKVYLALNRKGGTFFEYIEVSESVRASVISL